MGGKGWLKPHVLIAAGALIMLYFGGLGAIPYFEPDEGRYTEIPREMLALKDFVLPHLNGVLYFEKPPLYYWFNALSMAVLGVGEFSSRFWSAMLGLLGLVPVFYLGAKARPGRTAWLGVLILATSPLYLALAHLTIIDMTLTFFFTATLACFYLASEEEDRSRARWLWYGAFAGAALTVLAKGLIGVVLPGGIAFAYLLLGSRWSVLKQVPWIRGTLLFLAIALPWHVLAALRSPDFLWFYFVHEHFLRYLTTVSDRTEPWWFFLPIVIWALLPWTAFLPASLASLARPAALRETLFRRPSPELFLWLWAAEVVVFFSLSQSKLIPYILPALPPLAVLAALQVDEVLTRRQVPAPWLKGLLLLALLGVALFGAAFIWAGLGKIKAFSPPGAVALPLLLAGAGCAALALLAAAFVAAGRWKRAVPAMALCAAASFGCMWSAGPAIAQNRDVKGFAAFIQSHEQPGDLVFAYRFYPQTLPVYLRRPIGVAAFEGELAFGISKLPAREREARFPDAAQFAALWNGPARIWCVADKDALKKMAKDGLAAPVVLMEQRQVVLLTNHPLEGSRP